MSDPDPGALLLSWTQDLEDYLRAERRLVWRRLRLRWPLLGGLTLLGMAVLGALTPWLSLLMPVLVAALLLAATRARNLRKALEKRRGGLIEGEVRWEVGPGGLSLELPRRSLRLPWSGVREVHGAADQVLLYISRQRALFVPARAVEGGVAGFVAQVEGWRANPGSLSLHQPSPEAPWKFRWEPRIEDHIIYVRGVLGTRPSRPVAVIGGVIFGAALSQAGAALICAGEPLLGGFVIVVAMGFGALMVLGGLGGLASGPLGAFQVHLARWLDPDLFPIDPIELHFDDQGLSYRSVRGSGRLAWSTVTAVHDLPGCVAVMIGPLLGFAVPDRAFDGVAARQQFADQALRWQETTPRKREVDGVRGEALESDNPFAPPEKG